MSEWGASLTGVGTYGEWANVTVYPDFPSELPASRGVCVCVCVRARVCALCVHACVRMYVCIACVYLRINVCLHVCICVC